MLDVLTIIAPVFAIVILGYLAVRLKLYPPEGVKGLIAFVNNFATPFLLFRAMLGIHFDTAFRPPVIGSFYIAAFCVFAGAIFMSRKVFKRRPGEAVATGFSATFTNTVLLGIPIIQRAYGDQALQTIYTIIGFHASILLPMGMITMELARRDGAPLGGVVKQAGRRIITNPLMIGILLGLAGNFAGLELNEPADAFTRMMSQAVLPAALFGLGGALNAYRVRNDWKFSGSLAFMKLFVHPALAWLVLVPVLHVDPNIARYAVVLAGMPSGINVYIFATMYKRSEDIAASTILISTAFSVISVSFWLYVMAL